MARTPSPAGSPIASSPSTPSPLNPDARDDGATMPLDPARTEPVARAEHLVGEVAELRESVGLVDEVTGKVLDEIRPMLSEIRSTLDEMRYGPPRQQRSAPEPREERPPSPIHDDDIAFIAANLTPAQFDQIVAIRRGAGDLKRWSELGAVPGVHLIPTINVTATVRGNRGQLVKDVPVEIAHLDPAEMDKLRQAGHLVGPGEALAPAA